MVAYSFEHFMSFGIGNYNLLVIGCNTFSNPA